MSEFDRDQLMAAVAKIRAHIKVNRDYDIPFVAGYSQDGKTVYIDRHLPALLEHDGQTWNLDDYLVLHEVAEKLLIDTFGMTYLEAHAVACLIDRSRAILDGSYDAYLTTLSTAWKGDKIERITRVPADLDLTPYRNVGSMALQLHLQFLNPPPPPGART